MNVKVAMDLVINSTIQYTYSLHAYESYSSIIADNLDPKEKGHTI